MDHIATGGGSTTVTLMVMVLNKPLKVSFKVCLKMPAKSREYSPRKTDISTTGSSTMINSMGSVSSFLPTVSTMENLIMDGKVVRASLSGRTARTMRASIRMIRSMEKGSMFQLIGRQFMMGSGEMASLLERKSAE